MPEYTNARIVSHNIYGERACASAAKISTTSGNAFELFDGAVDSDANRKLIGKVLNSGHSSVIEHAVFTLALRDVSVYVEEYFIEHRLASFTVKSRRYVDFGGLGYHIPDGLDGDEKQLYCDYMDALFAAYKELLDGGIPKEDARFVLPYSFCSNFYCTVNARELVRMIADMSAGRGRAVPELREIARHLEEQLLELFPCFEKYLASQKAFYAAAPDAPAAAKLSMPVFISTGEVGRAELLQAPSAPEHILSAAIGVSGREEGGYSALFNDARPRELELINYGFAIRDITLSGITHLVRHRMQSVIIPELRSIALGRVIMPASVDADAAMRRVYTGAVERAYSTLLANESSPVFTAHRQYFMLSGTLTDVISSMNARELSLFCELRCCERAQWEIRKIAVGMLSLLRGSFPALFDALGPSCYVKGYCPEGRLGCGRMDEVRARFGTHEIE